MLPGQQEVCLAGSCGEEQLPFHSVNTQLTVAGSSQAHAATCICHGTRRDYFETTRHDYVTTMSNIRDAKSDRYLEWLSCCWVLISDRLG